VEADNPRELAGAIKSIASQSPETLADYGVRGRRYIEEKYSIPTLVDRFEALALELAGSGKSHVTQQSK
jgi:hypothetical protein